MQAFSYRFLPFASTAPPKCDASRKAVGLPKPLTIWRKWDAKNSVVRDLGKPVSGLLGYQGQHRGLHFSIDQSINCFRLPRAELDFGPAGRSDRSPDNLAGGPLLLFHCNVFPSKIGH